LKIAERNNEIDFVIKYNTFLSLNYHDFERYEKGVFYGKKAIKLLDLHHKNTLEERRFALNATAINYDDWNKPDSALFYHYKVVKLAKGSDTLKIDQTYNNIGNTLLKQKRFVEARKWLLKSNKTTNFKYILKPKDVFFNYQKSTVINNLATIAYELQEYENAEKLFDSSAYYSIKSKSVEKMRDYYYHRAVFNKKRGFFEKTVLYQDAYIKLRDSVFDIERAANFEELETKYQTEKKEKELLKSKALALETAAQIKKKDTQFMMLFVFIFGILLISYLIYRQQKLKNKQQVQEFELKTAISQIETQNKLQEQRLNISRDLHDNIGSQLTFIISSVDNIKYAFDIDNKKLDDKLTKISSFAQDTIIELRDTIWAMNSNEITFEDLEIRINNYIEKAKEAKDRIQFLFAIDVLLKSKKLTSVEGMNIYRTIQEAINNTLKYAQATTVAIAVNKTESQIEISIKDNGIGFDLATTVKGNGLHNMQKRMEDIGGEFTLISTLQGTTITLFMNA
jgi:signal transduction histidine kinase